jgi:hypothetical protein
VAYLGAAEQFTIAHLDKPENQQLIAQAESFYVEVRFKNAQFQ